MCETQIIQVIGQPLFELEKNIFRNPDNRFLCLFLLWVEAGTAIDVKCSAEHPAGNPPPDIQLFQDGNNIANGPEFNGSFATLSHRRNFDKTLMKT